ncbi:MAG: hypothetical protein EPN34_12400 [Burkholderiaceae bacterium]|nr:MAG: hypothetical protein EPN34_12400 [Burkholderiaceae bacterium]
MSRGGTRYGAGRPGWHAKTGALPSIDLRRITRAKLMDCTLYWRWPSGGEPTATATTSMHDGFMRFEYARGGKHATEDVQIARTGCTYGGSRPWFRCPCCRRRCAVLYVGERLACRECYRLRYPSQSEDAGTRVWDRKRKLAKRLGCEAHEWDEAEKPRGMHWSTFERIRGELSDLDAWLDAQLVFLVARSRPGWLPLP